MKYMCWCLFSINLHSTQKDYLKKKYMNNCIHRNKLLSLEFFFLYYNILQFPFKHTDNGQNLIENFSFIYCKKKRFFFKTCLKSYAYEMVYSSERLLSTLKVLRIVFK